MSGIELLLIIIAVGLIATAVILYFRYPFLFLEIGHLDRLISSPNILPPDHTISTIKQLDSFIEKQIETSEVPGTAVSVIANGEIIWQKGYGVTHLKNPQAITPNTPFMLGSISKSVMGAALMHAVEHNLLDLDANINDYLDYAVKNPRISQDQTMTLRHLATHTSGIIDRTLFYTNSYNLGDSPIPLARFMQDYLAKDGKNFQKGNFIDSPVGQTYEYSNIAASLVAQIIHNASGMPLNEYTKTHFFGPLDMASTGWFLSDFDDPTQIASPHVMGKRPYPHYGYPTWPEGQLRASANDLAQFLGMAMHEGSWNGRTLLKPETVAQMIAKQPFSGLESGPGQGHFWEYTKSGLIGHNGGDMGVMTAMYFNPDTKVGTVILTNCSTLKGIGTVFTILRQILTGEGSPNLV